MNLDFSPSSAILYTSILYFKSCYFPHCLGIAERLIQEAVSFYSDPEALPEKSRIASNFHVTK